MNIQSMIPDTGPVPQLKKHIPALEDLHDGILVRTPNWMGDAVMSIPALFSLKQSLPEYCGLFVLAPASVADIFRALPFVDSVATVSDPHAFMTQEERETVRLLHAGLCLMLNNSLRDTLSIRRCGIRKIYGAAARGRSFLLAEAWKFPPGMDRVLNSPHQAAKYLAMAQALGGKNCDGSFPVFREAATDADIPDIVRNALASSGKVLAIAAGAAYGGAKMWPRTDFAEVCRLWIEKENGTVVLLGSPKESSGAAEIISKLPADKAFDLTGKTTVDQLVYILKRVAACTANDSGVMHLAAACGTPGVAPYGPTDPAATSPLSKRWRILYASPECGPCFKRECPLARQTCFDGITPELVYGELHALTAEVR